jgi:hypothetical protein
MPQHARQTAHVDDAALEPAKIRQREFAGNKIPNQINPQRDFKLFDGTFVDRSEAWKNSCVVDQAVKATATFDSSINRFVDLARYAHIAFLKLAMARSFRIQAGRHLFAIFRIHVANQNRRPCLDEHFRAASADALTASRNEDDFIRKVAPAAHPWPPGWRRRLATLISVSKAHLYAAGFGLADACRLKSNIIYLS